MDWIFDDENDDYDLFHHQSEMMEWETPDRRGLRRDPTPPGSNDSARSLLRSLSPEERSSLPKQLNQMQQRVLPTVLGTDESVVLSAPTGAGKTCVLDMAILRSLLIDENARIYYVAPSKALCRLQGLGFSQRFKQFGLTVDVVTGDEGQDEEDGSDGQPRTHPSLSSAMTSIMFGTPIPPQGAARKPRRRLVVCTPEKFEAETRRCSDSKLLGNQKVLILVDEVHHLGEAARGATLELVLTRFLWVFRHCRQNVRFVCVSATIPNVDMVARWLGNGTYFEFHNRPVPLNVHVLGFQKASNRADFLFEQDLDRQVPEVLRTYGTGKPALVFVSSRKGAKDLAVKLREAGFGSRQANTRGVQADDDVLTECLRAGIGFHTAGLTSNDRACVENLFREGKLAVVCCTSTLAVGVDLPANLVIVKSTKAYRGPLLGFQDIERATLIQMIGRAGRPGYDTEGTAVILTAQGEESKYVDLSNGLLAVTSRLSAEALQEGLNAEIVRGRLKTTRDCAEWWGMTFAGVSSNLPWNESELSALEAMKCVRIHFDEGDNFGLETTATGRTASTHHLRLATVSRFSEMCRTEASPETGSKKTEEKRRWDLETLARLICDGAEFDDLIPRRDQKKILNAIAWSQGRFRSPKSVRVTESKDVAFQLLQARLGGVALTDHSLRQSSNHVFERAPRLARALLKMLVDARSNKAVICALLCKCLETKCWETDELGQLDSVGAKTKEKLESQGLRTLQDVLLPSNASVLPAKALNHARSIVTARKVPVITFSDSALAISLSADQASSAGPVPAASSNKSQKRSAHSRSEWWLACIGGPENKLIGWAETVDRLVVPVVGIERMLVFAIHRRWFGIDTKLVVELDEASRQFRIVSAESSFWDGFHLSPEQAVHATPKVARTKKRASSTNESAKAKSKAATTIDTFFATQSDDVKKLQTSIAVLRNPVSTNPFAEYEYRGQTPSASPSATNLSGIDARASTRNAFANYAYQHHNPQPHGVRTPLVHGRLRPIVRGPPPFVEEEEEYCGSAPLLTSEIRGSWNGLDQPEWSTLYPMNSEPVSYHPPPPPPSSSSASTATGMKGWASQPPPEPPLLPTHTHRVPEMLHQAVRPRNVPAVPSRPVVTNFEDVFFL